MKLEQSPMPPQKPGEAPEEEDRKRSLIEVENLFDVARNEFDKSAPDFSKIRRCIADISKEINDYREDFGIILREEEEYGGGIKQQGQRIENMRKAIPRLKSMITEAESIIASNESFYGPYKKQVDAAKKIVEALEKI